MKLMVLDGNSLINRAYHGVRPLNTSQGLQTNAIFGFITTLQRLTDEEKQKISLSIRALLADEPAEDEE